MSTGLLPPLQGEGWGGDEANGALIDEVAARKSHPPPNLPLEGGSLFFSCEPDAARLILRDLVNATVAFAGVTYSSALP